jgi:hypothetical protein
LTRRWDGRRGPGPQRARTTGLYWDDELHPISRPRSRLARRLIGSSELDKSVSRRRGMASRGDEQMSQSVRLGSRCSAQQPRESLSTTPSLRGSAPQKSPESTGTEQGCRGAAWCRTGGGVVPEQDKVQNPKKTQERET